MSAYEIALDYELKIRKLEYPDRNSFSDKSLFRKAQREYREKENALVALFKKDLLEELGVLNHSKADTLWNLAWEHGHSCGLGDVALYADEFSELMSFPALAG